MSALSAMYGIVARDLTRTTRQKGRLLGGIVRPFMWLLLVGTGFNAIAQVEGGVSYQAFVYPGIVVMAALFGAMLMAISTVYDREFGMLRLMLASPAGVPAVLTGRALAATIVGFASGCRGAGAGTAFRAGLTAQTWPRPWARWPWDPLVSSVLGLLVAARLRSVENFAGVINVVLFPLLFVSGALYPTGGMPSALRLLARINPVTYQVDLMRHAFGQPTEFSVRTDILVSDRVGPGAPESGRLAVRSGAAVYRPAGTRRPSPGSRSHGDPLLHLRADGLANRPAREARSSPLRCLRSRRSSPSMGCQTNSPVSSLLWRSLSGRVSAGVGAAWDSLRLSKLKRSSGTPEGALSGNRRMVSPSESVHSSPALRARAGTGGKKSSRAPAHPRHLRHFIRHEGRTLLV